MNCMKSYLLTNVYIQVGYAHHQVPVQVAGVADVPVTKIAYTHGVTQKLVDVAQPGIVICYSISNPENNED